MELLQESLNGSVKLYRINPSKKQKYDLELLMAKSTSLIIQTLFKEQNAAEVEDNASIKYQLATHVRFVKREYDENGDSIPRYVDPYFLSESRIYDADNVIADCETMNRSIIAKFDVFVEQGSGFTLDKILDYRLKLHRFVPLQGGGHNNKKKAAALPPHIKKKKACLDIKNTDNLCFIYACLAHLHPVKTNPTRSSQYIRYLNELNFTGFVFPLSLKSVKEFEKRHRHLAVNVLGYENGTFIPLYRSMNRTTAEKDKEINMLMYKKHYYLIRHMSRLLNRTSGQTWRYRSHYCHWCLCRYSSATRLEEHYQLCRGELQRLRVPEQPNQTIQFTNYRNVFRLPFVIYYDSESMLVPTANGSKDHVPISICSFTKCTNDAYTLAPKVFTGYDCMQRFLDHLQDEEERIETILMTYHSEMTWNDEDDARLRRAQHCDICKVPFTSDQPKYRDHDHLNANKDSNIRYITCNRCNLTYGRQRACCRIPVVAHNSNRYDIHHVILALKRTKGVKVLAKNSETFIALNWGRRLTFIDSVNFMAGSLNGLASLLPDAEIRSYTCYITEQDRLHELLKQKGVFPYDYMDSFERLHDTSLPPIEKFYDTLNETNLPRADYVRAQRVWKAFDCNTLQEYMELYVCLDTLLLAAVVESYRQSTHRHFQLDPMHYLTAPSMCWDAMLKITGVKLQMLTSVDMYLFFSNSIRGGITGTSTRHAKANNDYCAEFDERQPISHILSFHVNNLYGMSLSQALPTDHFRWMTSDELKEFNAHAVPENGKRGYFVEVDLEYPQELHDVHNEFPLAPEKLDVPRSEWSEHTRHLASQLGLSHKSSGLKLMTTLRDKKRYTLHHETLKVYLRLGMKVTRIYKGVTFTQSPFMKTYISLNTEARKTAQSQFEIALYKGYNNYIFGKTCYNVFRQKDMKLVDNKSKFQRLVARPTFHSSHILNDDLTLVEMKPATIVCNKPVYIGCTVLELSKAHMYHFYYDYLIPMYYQTGLQMLYADTDSFYVQVNNRPDVYHDMAKHHYWFDCSSYPPSHFLHSNEHKRQIGLMKDIHGLQGHITEFIALRSKMYAVRVDPWYDDDDDDDDCTITKAKGIHRSVLKGIPFSSYLDTLRNNTVQKHKFKRITSKKHHLVTVESSKDGLCAYDDKRMLLSCGVHSYAYGHYLGGNAQCLKNHPL